MTNISRWEIHCTCGHSFSARIYESVNTQLSSDAVEAFLRDELNRPECPKCHERLRGSIPVLFHDMEREFMVWAGNDCETDGYIAPDGDIIYTHDYLAAVAAMAAFRADSANAALPFGHMTAAKKQEYVQSFLKLYRESLLR